MTDVDLSAGSVGSVLALTRCPGLGPGRIAALLDRFGSADAVLGSSVAALAEVRGIGEKVARHAAAGFAEAVAGVPDELERIAAAGARVIVRGGPGYPALLAPLPQAPPLLIVRGDELPGADGVPVGVIGSRRCSSYGLEQAGRFARSLAREGSVIVSGGARGIDGAAHKAALDVGGLTVVVLGCGIDRVYPPEHAGLFEDVAAAGGCVVTELPCGTEPTPANFPARNRIISGLSLGVLVIEAAERSGALITARLAAEEHGREVMALPGRVDASASAGTLALIKSGGASLVTEPADVMRQIEGPAWLARNSGLFDTPARNAGDLDTASAGEASRPTETDPGRAALLSALSAETGGLTAEDLAERTGTDLAATRSTLTLLEIAGRVTRSGARFLAI